MSDVSRRATPGDLAQSKSAALHSYLIRTTSEPWEWGVYDCCSFVADWVVECGHPDPMARWRGKYDSEQGARDFIERSGGLCMIYLLGMSGIGLPEPDSPQLGDVGVVRVMGEHGPEEVGAIFGGKRWHLRSPNGLSCARVEPCMIWRV